MERSAERPELAVFPLNLPDYAVKKENMLEKWFGFRFKRILNWIINLKRKQKQTLSLPFFIENASKFTEKVSNDFPLQKKIFAAIMAVLEPVQRKAPSRT